MSYYDQSGAIHLHSVHSFDGRISVTEIMKAANRCGLDFVMLTDHSNQDAKPQEGWHDDVLLIVGQEISPRFNHYLAFGCRDVVNAEEGDDPPPQQYIDEVNVQGGFGIIAHPDHEGTEMFHVKHYPWRDWSATGFTGMSIWDFMTDWQAKLNNYPRSILGYLLPALALTGPKRETLRRWDGLSATRPVVGIGELDNHDTVYNLWGLHVRAFPFARVFRLIRTHVLTPRPFERNKTDGMVVLDALRRGHAYIAMEYFSEATGFRFLVSGDDFQGVMGDEYSLQGRVKLTVLLPEEGNMRILKNGAPLKERMGRNCEVIVSEPGVYRCEVYQRHWGALRPWIFSNPIYLR